MPTYNLADYRAFLSEIVFLRLWSSEDGGGIYGGIDLHSSRLIPPDMLSDAAIRRAKPGAKARRLHDGTGTGLYIEIAVSGSKLWRLKYRLDGKEKLLALGAYPEVGIGEARSRALNARALIARGIEPLKHRAELKAAEVAKETFATVAAEYLTVKLAPIRSVSYVDRLESRLRRDIYPYVGELKPNDITAVDLLAILRRVEGRGAVETAHRELQSISQVFRYAIATGRATTDPTRDLRGALAPVKKNHFPAPLDPHRIGQILLAFDSYRGTPVVEAALKLAPLVFVRPGELRKAEWADIDLDASEWRYLVTKTETQHIVPLAPRAVSILEELRPLTGAGRYVFPSARSPKGDRPMSDNAILVALRAMGIAQDELVGHSWRAIARTLLEETLGFPAHIIEQQLAHAVRDPLGRAYNRTTHLAERKAMMVAWADYLDKLRLLTAPLISNVLAFNG